MPATPNLLTVDPSGLTVTVDISDSFGTSITAYTASGGGTAHTLPLELSTPTAFHLTSAGAFTVSVLWNGVQVGGETVQVTQGAPVVYVVKPVTAARLSSLLADRAKLAPSLNTQTESYTLVLADAGKTVQLNVGSGNTLTVPPNVDVAFPIGTTVRVAQIGAGQTTLTAGAGVTISKNPGTLKLTGQYSVASLYKNATNVWIASGDLAAA